MAASFSVAEQVPVWIPVGSFYWCLHTSPLEDLIIDNKFLHESQGFVMMHQSFGFMFFFYSFKNQLQTFTTLCRALGLYVVKLFESFIGLWWAGRHWFFSFPFFGIGLVSSAASSFSLSPFWRRFQATFILSSFACGTNLAGSAERVGERRNLKKEQKRTKPARNKRRQKLYLSSFYWVNVFLLHILMMRPIGTCSFCFIHNTSTIKAMQ